MSTKTSRVPAWACSRCECYEGIDSENVSLLGGLRARLCIKCRNAWHELFQTTLKERWSRYSQMDMEVKALLGLCKAGQDKRVELEALRKEVEEYETFFYEASKAFMKSIPEDEKAGGT